MPLTRTSTIRLMKFGFAGLIIILIAAYAVWRSLNYARGPEIVITQPTNGDSISISTSTILITGQLLRATNLTLNGQAIAVDQQGNFSQLVTIFPGINVETMVATDQFKRSVTKELTLDGTAEFPIQNTGAASKNSKMMSTSTM